MNRINPDNKPFIDGIIAVSNMVADKAKRWRKFIEEQTAEEYYDEFVVVDDNIYSLFSDDRKKKVMTKIAKILTAELKSIEAMSLRRVTKAKAEKKVIDKKQKDFKDVLTSMAEAARNWNPPELNER